MATSSLTRSRARAQAEGSFPCVCTCEGATVASGPGWNGVRAGAWCRLGGPRGNLGRLEGRNTKHFSVCCLYTETRGKHICTCALKTLFFLQCSDLKVTLLFKQLRGLISLTSDFRAEAPDAWLETLFPWGKTLETVIAPS